MCTIIKIKKAIAEQCAIDDYNDISDDTDIVTDLAMDSLDLVEFQWVLEELLGNDLNYDEVIDLRTPRQLAEYIDKNIKDSQGESTGQTS